VREVLLRRAGLAAVYFLLALLGLGYKLGLVVVIVRIITTIVRIVVLCWSWSTTKEGDTYWNMA